MTKTAISRTDGLRCIGHRQLTCSHPPVVGSK
jgi:hypothetical protein